MHRGAAAGGRPGRPARTAKQAPDTFTLRQHVNDRPYAASSLLRRRWAGCSAPRCAATPATGRSSPPGRSRWSCGSRRCAAGAARRWRALFAPLGWTVEATPVPLDAAHPEWGDQPVRRPDADAATLRLADALNHLYVLLPVLDDAKHYWVSSDEVEKLLRAGERLAGRAPGAGADHAGATCAHRTSLTSEALARLPRPTTTPTPTRSSRRAAAEEPAAERAGRWPRSAAGGPGGAAEAGARPASWTSAAAPGALLAELLRDRRFTEIVGADVSPVRWSMAARRLRLDRLPERQPARIPLLQTALTYRDDRLRGFDAAVLMEVIEHVDPPRLPALRRACSAHGGPATVVVTTPNVEYNVRYQGLPPGACATPTTGSSGPGRSSPPGPTRSPTRYGYTVATGRHRRRGPARSARPPRWRCSRGGEHR